MQHFQKYDSVDTINDSKLEAMLIYWTWPTKLNEVVSSSRSKQRLGYLEIMLTHSFRQLFDAKYKNIQ